MAHGDALGLARGPRGEEHVGDVGRGDPPGEAGELPLRDGRLPQGVDREDRQVGKEAPCLGEAALVRQHDGPPEARGAARRPAPWRARVDGNVEASGHEHAEEGGECPDPLLHAHDRRPAADAMGEKPARDPPAPLEEPPIFVRPALVRHRHASGVLERPPLEEGERGVGVRRPTRLPHGRRDVRGPRNGIPHRFPLSFV